MARRKQSGQALVEYALMTAGVMMPLMFMIVFASQMLWVWNSAVELTRDGARYAATHCWQGSGENVRAYMRTHVPVNIDQQQFISGAATLEVLYYSRSADTGALADFSCNGGECSVECIPDAVTVRITGYEYRGFTGYLGLTPIAMPTFQTSVPVESAGCDAEQGICIP